jgi:hypothetical protein
MKNLPLAAAAAFALIATGAAQAATPSAQPMAASQTKAAASSTNKGAVVDPDEMKTLNQHSLRAQLRENLSKSGFTDIKMIPSSFYIQAKNKMGEPVAMVIGPDSFTEVTEVKTGSPAKPQASVTQPQTKTN